MHGIGVAQKSRPGTGMKMNVITINLSIVFERKTGLRLEMRMNQRAREKTWNYVETREHSSAMMTHRFHMSVISIAH
jgi:hypothetical protein